MNELLLSKTTLEEDHRGSIYTNIYIDRVPYIWRNKWALFNLSKLTVTLSKLEEGVNLDSWVFTIHISKGTIVIEDFITFCDRLPKMINCCNKQTFVLWCSNTGVLTLLMQILMNVCSLQLNLSMSSHQAVNIILTRI